MGVSFEEYTIPMIYETISDAKTRNPVRGWRPTYNAIDCHDLTEYDAICGGDLMSCNFGDEEGVFADLMRFLVRMRGALTPPPRMDAPVTKMPLEREHAISKNSTA